MNIDEAIEKIDLIKGAIEDTKVHYKGMYLMCFLLGGLYIFQFIMAMLEIIMVDISSYALSIIFIMIEIIVLICYFLIYKTEKEFSNKYYLSLLSTWGFISFAVPIMASVVDLIGKVFFTETYKMDSIATTSAILGFSKVLLFSIFMIICSYILNNNLFRVLSILVLLGYFFLYICFFHEGIPFPFVPNQRQMEIGYVTIYTVLIVYFGYFIMGIYLKCKEGKEQN